MRREAQCSPARLLYFGSGKEADPMEELERFFPTDWLAPMLTENHWFDWSRASTGLEKRQHVTERGFIHYTNSPGGVGSTGGGGVGNFKHALALFLFRLFRWVRKNVEPCSSEKRRKKFFFQWLSLTHPPPPKRKQRHPNLRRLKKKKEKKKRQKKRLCWYKGKPKKYGEWHNTVE